VTGLEHIFCQLDLVFPKIWSEHIPPQSFVSLTWPIRNHPLSTKTAVSRSNTTVPLTTKAALIFQAQSDEVPRSQTSAMGNTSQFHMFRGKPRADARISNPIVNSSPCKAFPRTSQTPWLNLLWIRQNTHTRNCLIIVHRSPGAEQGFDYNSRQSKKSA